VEEEDASGYRPAARWPADLRGVTETVVTTLGPNDRWNVAALGIEVHPEDADKPRPTDAASDGSEPRNDLGGDSGGEASGQSTAPPRVTARTWGRTRTRRNFEASGEGYVQFTTDPVDFVEAALSVREADGPILESAAAWARVTVERIGAGREDGTEWVEWRLHPIESVVRHDDVPTINRGFNALVEATVVASRLDVAAYEDQPLEDRLEYLRGVVARCGGPREQTALDRLESLRGQ